MVARQAYGYILPDNGVAGPQLQRFNERSSWHLKPDAYLVAAVRAMLGHDAHEEIVVRNIRTVPVGASVLPVTYLVAVHNTLLASPFYLSDGTRILPSLGGNRIFPYASLGDKESTIGSEDLSLGVTAFRDLKELSRGMTYKWAALNIMMIQRFLTGDFPTDAELIATRMGGGKSVDFIHGLDALVTQQPDLMKELCPTGKRTPEALTDFEKILHRANAAVVADLKGRYIFAPDMNTDNAVMEYVRLQLSTMGSSVLPVACLSESAGGSGDPSRTTAEGVYYGMKGLVELQWPHEVFAGKRIGIQGVGKVGFILLQRLLEDQQPIQMFYISDTSASALDKAEELLKRYEKIAGQDYRLFRIADDGEDFYDLSMDIFSPNAKGQILTEDHVQRLHAAGCRLIAGGANNQRHPLQKDDVDEFMARTGIAYAPDYFINMGGILNVIYERGDVQSSLQGGFNPQRPMHVIRGLQSLLRRIVQQARETRVPSQRVADTFVEEHLARYAMLQHYRPDDLEKRTYLQI